MVGTRSPAAAGEAVFQYSLCRVVLMVAGLATLAKRAPTFSTRSVESF